MGGWRRSNSEVLEENLMLDETQLTVVEVKGALDLWRFYHVWLAGTEGRERLIYDGGRGCDKHTDGPFMKELSLCYRCWFWF